MKKYLLLLLPLVCLLSISGCNDKRTTTVDELAMNWWYFEIPASYDGGSIDLNFVTDKGPVEKRFYSSTPDEWKAGDLLKVVIIDSSTDALIYAFSNETRGGMVKSYSPNISKEYDQGHSSIANGYKVSTGDIILRKSRDTTKSINPSGALGSDDIGIIIEIKGKQNQSSDPT